MNRPVEPHFPPLTDDEEAFLAATWDSTWMTRPVKECRAEFRRILAARVADPGGLREGDAGKCPTCHDRTCIGRLQYEDCVRALTPEATAPDTRE